ncbi:Zinc finger FYVE domain-containing protein 21 [Nymphon striatum]|nr:Zinc finger FYVE domain-containing protein 21 [Nymphon striatum]
MMLKVGGPKKLVTCNVVNMAGSTMGGKKLVKSKSGLRIVPYEQSDKSPFELTEPVWIPDVEGIGEPDGAVVKHHCRRCGRIYCSNCCESKMPLTRMCFVDPVRLCESCADVTKKENEFFEKHMKTLINAFSGSRTVYPLPCNPLLYTNIVVCNSDLPILPQLADHWELGFQNMLVDLLFDGGENYKHEDIQLCDVLSVQVVKDSDDIGGAASINIKFKDMNCLDQVMKITAASVPNKKQSVTWINALHKAIKMLYESKASLSPP